MPSLNVRSWWTVSDQENALRLLACDYLINHMPILNPGVPNKMRLMLLES